MAENVQDTLELWRNVSNGVRWISKYDRLGREGTTVIKPGRSFTLTAFERQLNQDKVASAAMDMFRNGTFELVRPSNETIKDEVAAPNSYTETELDSLVNDVMASTTMLEDVLPLMTKPEVIDRLEEKLKAANAEDFLFSVIEDHRESLQPTVKVVRKRIVSDDEIATTEIVDEAETFVCDVCDFGAASKAGLSAHKRTHKKD